MSGDLMSGDPVTSTPTAADFRALARSPPWRFTTVHFTTVHFTTVHFTHRQQQDGGSTPRGEPVEAWLDRRAGRVTVRTPEGVEVAEGVPYSGAAGPSCSPDGHAGDAVPPLRSPEPVLRPDGLVAERPDGWHHDHGDPMWRDYRWTAMLDPEELSQGVDVRDVTATVLRGRSTWSAVCRPLLGDGEERDGERDDGYVPRCGCCPLLDSSTGRSRHGSRSAGLPDRTLREPGRLGPVTGRGLRWRRVERRGPQRRRPREAPARRVLRAGAEAAGPGDRGSLTGSGPAMRL